MRKYFFICFMALSTSVLSQDIQTARALLDTLTSKTMWGRGYTRNGMSKAADFISASFKAYGLSPMDGKTFKQVFSYPANTFPGKMSISLNGKALVPGKEFIVMPESKGIEAQGQLFQKDSVTFINPEQRIILVLKDKLTWSVVPEQADYTGIEVLKTAISGKPESIRLSIENQFNPEFQAANICGIVKGTSKPDSILLLSAHYDHLGGMGSEVYFPGANDNASGISFLMTLARHYASHPQPYSIAFICFAGEENGLAGSKYFTEHPLLDLGEIKFLTNVDMVGTGETGITVVNASIHPKEFALLQQLNDKNKYLVKINPRGKAANSDHYFFTEKGVPAFFIYTQGGISAYHDVNDLAKTLPFTEYKDLFSLFLDFYKGLMK
ncbi:aminopeptidase [Pedobacter sp. KBW06]|uniref:M28 family metallopeptidase n=1 Tax=Pedobacter sp. KBW06 TaxID=2153359 RepID=UPI000F598B12|nr:M28 family peptidase [Pedobacter sp. KBW06]RQO67825.1 aminopeptidase [Pedobacter sp. KBW06]